MARIWLVTVMAVLAAPTARVFGQSASWRFHWGKGQIMTYRVEHLTTVTELENGKKMEVTSRLNLLKRWQVQDVDSQGNADISLTLAQCETSRSAPAEKYCFSTPSILTRALRNCAHKWESSSARPWPYSR